MYAAAFELLRELRYSKHAVSAEDIDSRWTFMPIEEDFSIEAVLDDLIYMTESAHYMSVLRDGYLILKESK